MEPWSNLVIKQSSKLVRDKALRIDTLTAVTLLFGAAASAVEKPRSSSSNSGYSYLAVCSFSGNKSFLPAWTGTFL